MQFVPVSSGTSTTASARPGRRGQPRCCSLPWSFSLSSEAPIGGGSTGLPEGLLRSSTDSLLPRVPPHGPLGRPAAGSARRAAGPWGVDEHEDEGKESKEDEGRHFTEDRKGWPAQWWRPGSSVTAAGTRSAASVGRAAAPGAGWAALSAGSGHRQNLRRHGRRGFTGGITHGTGTAVTPGTAQAYI